MSSTLTSALAPIPAATGYLGVGRSTVYELIAAGELETVKIGARRLIVAASMDAYIERLRSRSTPAA